ncbi:MAG: hypothetical protein WA771_16030 [Chthoniobacterales bacterium]
MAATIVLVLIAIAILFFVFRAKTSHSVSRGEFIEILQSTADGSGDLADYRGLVHNPILNDPELEAARGRLVHLDDKHGRSRGEHVSDAHRQEITELADELRASLIQ